MTSTFRTTEFGSPDCRPLLHIVQIFGDAKLLVERVLKEEMKIRLKTCYFCCLGNNIGEVKGTVLRDFSPQLFFMKHISLGRSLKPKCKFEYGFKFVEIFKSGTFFGVVSNNADNFSAV
jgi:hypothetical protein